LTVQQSQNLIEMIRNHNYKKIVNYLAILILFQLYLISCNRTSKKSETDIITCHPDSLSLQDFANYVFQNKLTVVCRSNVIHLGYINSGVRESGFILENQGKLLFTGSDTNKLHPVQFYRKYSKFVSTYNVGYVKSTDTSVQIDFCGKTKVFIMNNLK